MGVGAWKMLPCTHKNCTEVFGKAARLVEHRREVHGELMDITQAEILEAVKCVQWQDFRTMLKGMSTQRKFVRLSMYLRGDDYCGVITTCCTDKTRRVQVLNYLNALSRGGLIEPLSNPEKAKLWVEPFHVQARIRR